MGGRLDENRVLSSRCGAESRASAHDAQGRELAEEQLPGHSRRGSPSRFVAGARYPGGECARKDPQQHHATPAVHASGGCTMQDIGLYFGLHYLRVSEIVRPESQYRSGAKGKT